MDRYCSLGNGLLLLQFTLLSSTTVLCGKKKKMKNSFAARAFASFVYERPRRKSIANVQTRRNRISDEWKLKKKRQNKNEQKGRKKKKRISSVGRQENNIFGGIHTITFVSFSQLLNCKELDEFVREQWNGFRVLQVIR